MHRPDNVFVEQKVWLVITATNVKLNILGTLGTGRHVIVINPKKFPVNSENFADELAVDFIFTFKLRNDDKDNHTSEIYLYSIPYKVRRKDF